ncbi:MAG: hypothetical protein Q8910_02770 [Bacteroidota bacterium]|nr:hypothetical protein [Bacteroidota bacterium]
MNKDEEYLPIEMNRKMYNDAEYLTIEKNVLTDHLIDYVEKMDLSNRVIQSIYAEKKDRYNSLIQEDPVIRLAYEFKLKVRSKIAKYRDDKGDTDIRVYILHFILTKANNFEEELRVTLYYKKSPEIFQYKRDLISHIIHFKTSIDKDLNMLRKMEKEYEEVHV